MRIAIVFSIMVLLGLGTNAQESVNNDENFRFKHLTNPYAHPWLSKTSLNLGVGLSAYSGDLANATHFSRQRYHMNPHVNLDLQRRMTDYLSWRLSLNYFQLYAESAPGTQEITKFKGDNQDAYLAIQIDLNPRPYLESRYRKFNVYLLGGIGAGRFDTRDGNNDPIPGLEPYVDVVFPVGIGVEFFINDFIDIGFEAVQRFTLTDEIDGKVVTNLKPISDTYLLYGFKGNFKVFRKFKYKGYLRRIGH